MTDVLAHVVASITPASGAHAEAARARVAAAGVPILERLAGRLGGAQHTARPRAARRAIVVIASDHPAGDPGIALGAAHPTVVAARAITDGDAALARLARAANVPVIVVDAGVAEPASIPAAAVRLGPGHRREAMTVVDAALGLDAGIALAVSLVDDGLDVVAVGALGVGAELASAALLGAITGVAPTIPGDPEAEAWAARGCALHGASGRELLAHAGATGIAVLAGFVLAAASMNVPVILDDHATAAAALVAAVFAPTVTDSLIAAHAGTFVQRGMLAHLVLDPVFELGLGHGEGIGAAMVLALAEQVASL